MCVCVCVSVRGFLCASLSSSSNAGTDGNLAPVLDACIRCVCVCMPMCLRVCLYVCVFFYPLTVSGVSVCVCVYMCAFV